MMNSKQFIKSLDDITDTTDKKICVALSGGADSVSLLSVLNEIKNIKNINLSAVHVNHNLRGNESLRDENFCKNLCNNLGIKLYTFSIDVCNSRMSGESIELCARRLRYECFEKIDCDYIATAHNADDAIETFLLNFTRGTGLKGLCSIPALRGKYIRPLLCFSHDEIIEYLNNINQDFVVDSTNLSDDYSRNKIRHNVIPVLKQINPSLEKTAFNNISLLSADFKYIKNSVDSAYKEALSGISLKTDIVLSKPDELISLIIKKYFNVFPVCDDKIHIEQAVALLKLRKNGKIQLSNGYFFYVDNGYMTIKNYKKMHYEVKTEIMSAEKFLSLCKINNLLLKTSFDYDKIIGKLIIRTRANGDKLKLAGRGVTKQLRRLQAEKGFEPEQRDMLPVISDDKGIVWAYGIGADERVAIDGNTIKIITVYVNGN